MKTNFEIWKEKLIVEEMANIFCSTNLCTECPAYNDCDLGGDFCMDGFMKWANSHPNYYCSICNARFENEKDKNNCELKHIKPIDIVKYIYTHENTIPKYISIKLENGTIVTYESLE